MAPIFLRLLWRLKGNSFYKNRGRLIAGLPLLARRHPVCTKLRVREWFQSLFGNPIVALNANVVALNENAEIVLFYPFQCRKALLKLRAKFFHGDHVRIPQQSALRTH